MDKDGGACACVVAGGVFARGFTVVAVGSVVEGAKVKGGGGIVACGWERWALCFFVLGMGESRCDEIV